MSDTEGYSDCDLSELVPPPLTREPSSVLVNLPTTSRYGRRIRPVQRLTANQVWTAAHEEADTTDDDSGCETPEEEKQELPTAEDLQFIAPEGEVEYETEVLDSEEEEAALNETTEEDIDISESTYVVEDSEATETDEEVVDLTL